MAALTEEQKTFIVQSLACFDSPSLVAKEFKAQFGQDIIPQHCESYDHTKKAGKTVGKKWKALFDATRKAFLDDTSQIPIANRAVRLRSLQRMANNAEFRGNAPLAAQLIEQAAKEVGNAYTNRHQHEHSGPGGGPIENRTIAVDEKAVSKAASELRAEF